jgi:hypothetical protein
MTRTSHGTPNSAHASAASFIVGQSESLPIKIPTNACGFGFFGFISRKIVR